MGGGFAFGSGRGGGCFGVVPCRRGITPFFVLRRRTGLGVSSGCGRLGWGVLKRRTGWKDGLEKRPQAPDGLILVGLSRPSVFREWSATEGSASGPPVLRGMRAGRVRG
ncbi:hypothetical protein Srut_48860 [Streptomyces rutgersensis]|nr:hypothetical protein Srut_48860 [Streptomyces rutgersensis]